MNKDNINTVAHRWLKEKIQKDWVCLDATAGNGNDTFFLCNHASKVFAFDIQTEAKENTLKRCTAFHNLEFHLISHEVLDEVIKEPLDCALFNFGYLPHGDLQCITKPDSSLVAVKKAYDLLKTNGVLMLSCYLKHEGGTAEHEVIFKWIQTLKNIELRTYTQAKDYPILYEIVKKETL